MSDVNNKNDPFLTEITLLLFPVIIYLMWAFDFGEILLFASVPTIVQLMYISRLKKIAKSKKDNEVQELQISDSQFHSFFYKH